MSDPTPSTNNDAPRSELTPRAVGVGIVVAMLIGLSYPYVVLKIGFGPTASVTSAFFAYIGLSIVALISGKKTGRYEFNIVQTAGTAASQAAFMCVVLAAFDMLAAKPSLGFTLQPTPLQVFLWMTTAGCLGVLLAVPLRKHYIDEEKLTFADGTAAAEALVILDSGAASAKNQVRMLAAGGVFSAVTTWFRDGWPRLIPETTFFSITPGASWPLRWVKFAKFTQSFDALRVGINWSALAFGSGLIVGLRITMSMGLGMLFAWVIMPGVLVDQHIVDSADFKTVLRWVMWPATGLMVSGGLTALALKWKLIVRTFTDLRTGKMETGTDFPMSWVAGGSLFFAVALILIQKFSMGVAVWESVCAILISIVLMLVGIRVLGETNWAPISSMANMVQAIFAVISPGSIAVNMVASGMSGTVAGSGEHLMQDYKAGKIIGSNNRALTWMQLIATPIGAGCIAIVYPFLKGQYGIGSERYGLSPELAGSPGSGLSSPISVKWAGFAELLMKGIDQLPAYSLHALLVATVLGVAITIGEEKWKQYLPSPTGMALGMLIAAENVVPMLLGGLVQFIWMKRNAKSEEQYNTPLASGLIVGEALLALIIPLLIFFKLIPVPTE